jgi:putative endonuclease
MHWVYILKCSDQSYYTGSTDNLEKRISEHNSGYYGNYTADRRPVKLVFSQNFTSAEQAIRAERQIKGWSRRKKEALIKGDFAALRVFSKSRVNTMDVHASTGSV